MPRAPRIDDPGSWHHVFNRAIARRTLLERREDFRCFLAALACAVRRKEIEVHAYCLMSTHYHVLARSPVGRIDLAMHRVQLAYSRWFNRSRRRDGSLVRGRYGSRPVESERYREVLVRYIHDNPCGARLVDRPSRYPWSSAWYYARETGPPWLERSWVERLLGPSAYDERPERPAELAALVEARLAHPGGADRWDDVVGAADAETRAWMVRKALLADGTRPGLPLLPLPALERALETWHDGARELGSGRAPRPWRSVALVGLGRDLCGARLEGIAPRVPVSRTLAGRLYALHRTELQDATSYGTAVVELARRTLERWTRGT